VQRPTPDGRGISLPALLGLTVRQAASVVADLPRVRKRLWTLDELGLGYLTLGEATPALSGGEAQRLKLATELGRDQSDTLFVLDEPSVGLHPLDTRVLLRVIDRLTARGGTVVVIEHDLDLIANADWVIDMGPGGGAAGGRVVATGTPEQLVRDAHSATARHLRDHLASEQARIDRVGDDS
jgi:excinuclease ABC subunit A